MTVGLIFTKLRSVSPLPVMSLAVFLMACQGSDETTTNPETLSLTDMLGGIDTVGYSRALTARTFNFPEDHGPHESFRTEWWYVTGNLNSQDGDPFGFQFTIFRNALSPEKSNGNSAWNTNQAYMGHFTLTDINNDDFFFEEKFARGAVGLAGSETPPLRIWVEDWFLEGSNQNETVFPIRLSGGTDDIELDLTLQEGKPVVLQGEEGLSKKGSDPGNASFYFANTRMPATGTLLLNGELLEVSGLAWMDREWSTSALSDGQVGWDWFALHLDGGWDLMVYQLRREDGSADSLSAASLIDPSGRKTTLQFGRDILIQPNDHWRSTLGDAQYPSGWNIKVPSQNWDLLVEPAVDNQELLVTFRYWEGSVRVSGTGDNGTAMNGKGYAELTGYAEYASPDQ
jgi:predicted secreted hydrolase